MAENLVRNQDLSSQDRIVSAFRLLTSRKPDPIEFNILEELLQSQLAHYDLDPVGAKAMLTTGERPFDASLDPSQVAAYMVLASTLMNYDETVFKR